MQLRIHNCPSILSNAVAASKTAGHGGVRKSWAGARITQYIHELRNGGGTLLVVRGISCLRDHPGFLLLHTVCLFSFIDCFLCSVAARLLSFRLRSAVTTDCM